MNFHLVHVEQTKKTQPQLQGMELCKLQITATVQHMRLPECHAKECNVGRNRAQAAHLPEVEICYPW
jgi:hypothetical protein